MAYSTITQKWQLTIPKDVRALLNINSPGKVILNVDKKKKQLKIEPAEDILTLAKKWNLKAPKGMTSLKARELMEKNYQRI